MTDANPSDSGGRQDTCIDIEEKVEALTRELSEARDFHPRCSNDAMPSSPHATASPSMMQDRERNRASASRR